MDSMKRLIKESGIRDINNIAKRYKKAKIYFHQDLDGVTTALAMKNYLEQQGIEVVDAEIIQYGDKEFAIKKPEGEGEVMPVLVDFAHGKPMFVIHTDHHDTQAGAEETKATSFKASRSNVETISQSVSPKEIFPSEDLLLISIVDSANFAQFDITPEMVMNYLFRLDKDESLKKNKMMLGLVINKLLLSYKNKPRFLEDIVLTAKPSLLSILNTIKKISGEKGFASPEEMTKNKEAYVERQKENPSVQKIGRIITQYGLGSMTKPGAYDRYTPFRNNPDADFLVTGFPMGMVQASCNPFKKERALKGVDLGEIKDEVLEMFSSELLSQKITFGDIKKIAEMGANNESVGFTFKDMVALYGKAPSFKIEGGGKLYEILEDVSKKLYKKLSERQREVLDRVSVNGLDIIKANSGGHKCITNISGLSFLYRTKTKEKNEREEYQPILNYSGNNNFVNDIKNKLKKFGSLTDKQVDAALKQIEKETGIDQTPKKEKDVVNRKYTDLVKDIQNEFVKILNNKINNQETITESKKEKVTIESLFKKHISGKKLLSDKQWEAIMNKLDCIEDNRGQWDYPGKCTMINSKHITMKDVKYPVLGIDEKGHYEYMIPEKEYTFKGKKVFEIPYIGKYKSLIKKILDF